MSSTQLIINTDGGSRGNPGPAAVGVVACFDGKVVLEKYQKIGRATNNVAEYRGFLASLNYIEGLLEAYKPDSIQWRLDSLLVVEQLNRRWKIKDPVLSELASRVWEKLEHLSCRFLITHVPRQENSEADRLVNLALDTH